MEEKEIKKERGKQKLGKDTVAFGLQFVIIEAWNNTMWFLFCVFRLFGLYLIPEGMSASGLEKIFS